MKIIINNVYSTIVVGGTDHLRYPDLMKELRDYMSVAVDGAYFSKAYRRHGWDGRRYFITPKGRVATGFLPMIFRFIEEDYPKLDVQLIDERGDMPTIIKNIKKVVGDELMDDDYDFQSRIVKAVNNTITFRDTELYFPRGIIDAATNAGKTTILAGIINNLKGKNNILILIHRDPIFKQLVSYFEKFGPVGQISSKKYDIQQVTIGMIGTVYNRMKGSMNVKVDLSKFNVVVVDECHRAGGATYSKVLQNIHAPMRLFMSGSPLDSQNIVNKMIIVGLSGLRIDAITKRELMDRGISQEAEVNIHLSSTILPYPVFEYDELMDKCIKFSIERLNIINKIVKEADKPILISIYEIEHGNFLRNNIKADKVEFVHGTRSDKDQVIQDFKDGKVNVLISTVILKEGINIPNIRTLIIAGGGKAAVDIKQWLGRAERRDYVNTTVQIHDFYDIGKFISTHSKKRISIYKAENLSITKHYNEKDQKNFQQIIWK